MDFRRFTTNTLSFQYYDNFKTVPKKNKSVYKNDIKNIKLKPVNQSPKERYGLHFW